MLYSDIFTCLGVNRKHHERVINTVNSMTNIGGCWCFVEGKFNIVSRLWVNIRLFRSLLPYFISIHVEKVKLYGITDANVNVTRYMLSNVVYDELVIFDGGNLTTDLLSNMLVNINTVANVVIVNCPNVNIEELRNLYPAITFNVS